ncbi:MAG: endopeptidase La [Lentisphaeria bacterium]|nr:endopeptidase La [Lentisphaeria bacterium]
MDDKTISVGGMRKLGSTSGLFLVRNSVIFPFSLTPITIDTEANSKIVAEAMATDRMIAVFPYYCSDRDSERPELQEIPHFVLFRERISSIGVLCRIVREINLPDGTSRIAVRGVKRICYDAHTFNSEGLVQVHYHSIEEDMEANSDLENIARMRAATPIFMELASMLSNLSEEVIPTVENATIPGRRADIIADAVPFTREEKIQLLSTVDIGARLELLAVLLAKELNIAHLSMNIQSQVQDAMGDSQREFFLREQLRIVKRELGEESRGGDIAYLERKFENTELPENVAEVVQTEIERLECLPTSTPEFHISFSYVNWLLDCPWSVFTEDLLDCRRARKVLDEDHYGLEDVKSRILEFLAVLQLRGGEMSPKAPILCLVGPPGVGKTSIGQSIAKAMNRKFIRVSLGGVRDEAEIRGHRRTYVGAMPGRIIQNLKRVGSSNPVFMLDEVDKLAQDFRGDPGSALLEVLDPAQNHSFNDNYIELGYDLSKVFFIATANSIESIPGPLRDRMEIIRVSGYTSVEKREIAKRYLIPRQIKECGLPEKLLSFRQSGIDTIIKYYTMEAGVRELERVISQFCRKVAMKLIEKGEDMDGKITVDPACVAEYLGKYRYQPDGIRKDRNPGYALGMAWTGVGGTVLPIEILSVPGGKGVLKLTGSLGKVMQESAETAFSYVRSIAKKYGVDPEFFNTNDFHIHVPDGATPKDGPSAGVTLVTALISLISGKVVNAALSMTGEVTLHGHVTAVGGIREKVTSAQQAGVKYIILPEENRKDADELPEEVASKVKFFFVKDCGRVLQLAFADLENEK